ncbi:hypothetical protein SLE2022_303910 [Rubroshorea leprosula]
MSKTNDGRLNTEAFATQYGRLSFCCADWCFWPVMAGLLLHSSTNHLTPFPMLVLEEYSSTLLITPSIFRISFILWLLHHGLQTRSLRFAHNRNYDQSFG